MDEVEIVLAGALNSTHVEFRREFPFLVEFP